MHSNEPEIPVRFSTANKPTANESSFLDQMVPSFHRNQDAAMKFKSHAKSQVRRGRQSKTQNPLFTRVKSVPHL
jgi:hypothetical protein